MNKSSLLGQVKVTLEASAGDVVFGMEAELSQSSVSSLELLRQQTTDRRS